VTPMAERQAATTTVRSGLYGLSASVPIRTRQNTAGTRPRVSTVAAKATPPVEMATSGRSGTRGRSPRRSRPSSAMPAPRLAMRKPTQVGK
jgi:hypothetical protein